MSQKKLFIKGGMWLTVGYGLSALFSFLRNIVLARMVSVEDYGIASLFAVTMSLIEMFSDISIDKLLVQTKSQFLEKLQAVGQMFQFFRGVLSSVLMYILASPIAVFFHVPQATSAFEWFALVPLVRGLAHLDIMVMQRNLVYLPLSLSNAIPQIISFVALVVLGKWIGDYTIIVWVILTQNITYVFLTFYYAEKKYRWAYDPVLFKQMIAFGWPLLANGFLMFIIMQGDKTVIGAFFSAKELGWYSAAFALTLAPASVVANLLSSLFLPLISKIQNDVKMFQEYFKLTMQTYCMFGLLISLFFIYLGPQILVSLFGDQYKDASKVIILLGIMQGIRILKAGLTLVAMSKGETKNALFSNLSRAAIFFVLVFNLLSSNLELYNIAVYGLLGEICALTVSFYLLWSRLKIFDVNLIKQIFIFCLFLILSDQLVVFIEKLFTGYSLEAIKISFLLLAILVYSFFLKELKKKIINFFIH